MFSVTSYVLGFFQKSRLVRVPKNSRMRVKASRNFFNDQRTFYIKTILWNRLCYSVRKYLYMRHVMQIMCVEMHKITRLNYFILTIVVNCGFSTISIKRDGLTIICTQRCIPYIIYNTFIMDSWTCRVSQSVFLVKSLDSDPKKARFFTVRALVIIPESLVWTVSLPDFSTTSSCLQLSVSWDYFI